VNELEVTINEWLSEVKKKVKTSSYHQYECDAKQMLSFAKGKGITRPCQELYDAFASDGQSSKRRLASHLHMNRVIDLIAGTGATDPDGVLYNRPPYQKDPGYNENAVPKSFPVPSGTAFATVILIAEQALNAQSLSSGLYDLYKHGMLETYQYSVSRGISSYDDSEVISFYRDLKDRYERGSIPKWKWQLTRKSIFVLRMTAQTGSFPWMALSDVIPLDTPDLNGWLTYQTTNALENTVYQYLEQAKDDLADTTFNARKSLMRQLLRLASSMRITSPCQELYDAFLQDPNHSKDRWSLHVKLIRDIDRIAGTHALQPDGFMYNDPPHPSFDECQEAVSSLTFPVPPGTDISLVMSIVESGFRGLHTSESTIGQHHRIFREIYHFFYLRGSTEYSSETLDMYFMQKDAEYKAGQSELWKWKIRRRTVLLIKAVANDGEFRWSVIHRLTPLKDKDLEAIRQKLMTDSRAMNSSESSVSLQDFVFRSFLTCAGIDDASHLRCITHEDLAGALVQLSKRWCKNSASTLFPILRIILTKLKDMSCIDNDIANAVMRVSAEKGAEPYYLNVEGEKKLYELLDSISLRDRCIILLALELGLRESDIVLLKFDEINWDADQINLIQKKTRKEISVPLLPDVGNALMDYILHERPKRDDNYPFVFLRKQAPYNHLTSAHRILSRLLDHNNIVPVGANHRGLHLLRHTLAMRMLESSVPHQQISDVLGHTSPAADKSYITMEDKMLRLCALDYGDIPAPGWQLELEGEGHES
jgi:integrase